MLAILWTAAVSHWQVLAGGSAVVGILIMVVAALGPAAVLAILKTVPRWCWEVLIGLALILAFGAHERHIGAASVQKRWDADKAKKVAVAEMVAEEQAIILRQTITQYIERTRTITVQGQTITKEIPVYVTAQDDARCTINNGFVRVWNAANTGMQLPAVANGTDGQASGVKLSDVGRQHTIESTYSRNLEQQVIGLQDYLMKAKEASQKFTGEN